MWHGCLLRLPALALLPAAACLQAAPLGSQCGAPLGLPAGLLESRWFQQEASLPQRLFFLWLVGLVARFKY